MRDARPESSWEGRRRESRYVDFDDEAGCWGVFGDTTGHCYSTWASRRDAEQELRNEL